MLPYLYNFHTEKAQDCSDPIVCQEKLFQISAPNIFIYTYFCDNVLLILNKDWLEKRGMSRKFSFKVRKEHLIKFRGGVPDPWFQSQVSGTPIGKKANSCFYSMIFFLEIVFKFRKSRAVSEKPLFKFRKEYIKYVKGEYLITGSRTWNQVRYWAKEDSQLFSLYDFLKFEKHGIVLRKSSFKF